MKTEGQRYAMLNEDEEGNASEDDYDEGAFISLVISYHRGKGKNCLFRKAYTVRGPGRGRRAGPRPFLPTRALALRARASQPDPCPGPAWPQARRVGSGRARVDPGP